jgi:acetyltransferase-like isoleucine patch superfamily enzyme
MNLNIFLKVVVNALNGLKRTYFSTREDHFGYIAPTAKVITPFHGCKENTYLYDHTYIGEGANLHNFRTQFIMKRNSSSAFGLIIIGGQHDFDDLEAIPEGENWSRTNSIRPTVVNEGVWLGGNVILCEGVEIGRGCVVGAGAVVRGKYIPPYSILIGNPAKIIGFRFIPEKIIEYEKKFYTEEERLPLESLETNYEKYFISRISEIKKYTNLRL